MTIYYAVIDPRMSLKTMTLQRFEAHLYFSVTAARKARAKIRKELKSRGDADWKHIHVRACTVGEPMK